MNPFCLILLCLLGINLATYPQTNQLIPEAQAVKKAYADLLQNPDNENLQKTFITAFPENVEVFKRVFAPPKFDQLYENSDLYINNLAELSTCYPGLGGNKLIKLCIGLKKWDADAIGYIQHATMGFANSNYADFIGLIKQLNNQDLNTLTTFLADVENHSAYRDYQAFMDKLKSGGETELFDLFKQAKEIRISQKDH